MPFRRCGASHQLTGLKFGSRGTGSCYTIIPARSTKSTRHHACETKKMRGGYVGSGDIFLVPRELFSFLESSPNQIEIVPRAESFPLQLTYNLEVRGVGHD